MDKNVKQDLLSLMYMLTEDADKQIIISTAAGTYVGNFIPKEKNEKYHTVYAISDKLHQISDTEQTSSDSDVIVLVDPPSTLIVKISRAPLLSATFKRVSC